MRQNQSQALFNASNQCHILSKAITVSKLGTYFDAIHEIWWNRKQKDMVLKLKYFYTIV